LSWLITGLFSCGIAILIAIGLATPLGERDKPYFAGVKGAVLAYAISTLALVGFGIVQFTPPSIIASAFIAPLIEETTRVWAASRERPLLSEPRAWLLFGAGYGIVEGIIKVVPMAFQVAQGLPAVYLAVPLVPVLMHVALGLLMCALLYSGRSGLTAASATFAIHSWHNFTTPSLDQWIDLLLRGAVFVALIWAVLRFGRRFTPMTTGDDHAKAPP
jgi:hypothetical protein